MKCFVDTDVTRMPSINAVHSALRMNVLFNKKFPSCVDVNSGAFVLNPDKSLINVQNRLKPYLEAHKGWNGIVGRSPSSEEMRAAIEDCDIFL